MICMSAMDKLIVTVGITVGTAAVALGSVVLYKISNFAKRFDKSVAELSKSTVDDIQRVVVQDAVDKAAKNSVNDYMRDMNRVVLSEAQRELQKEAAKAVDEARKDIQSRVTDEVSSEVSRIDIDEMRREVRQKAEQKVLSKFNDDLQDVADKFGQSLRGVGNIYSTVANDIRKAVMRDDGREVKLSL